MKRHRPNHAARPTRRVQRRVVDDRRDAVAGHDVLRPAARPLVRTELYRLELAVAADELRLREALLKIAHQRIGIVAGCYRRVVDSMRPAGISAFCRRIASSKAAVVLSTAV